MSKPNTLTSILVVYSPSSGEYVSSFILLVAGGRILAFAVSIFPLYVFRGEIP
jgi:hypothetical protein